MQSKTLTPVHDRIFIKKLEVEKESISSSELYIPQETSNMFHRGEVIAVGPGRRLHSGELLPLSVKPGDVVIFPKHAGCQVGLGYRKDFLILRDDDIIGIETL